MIILTAIAVDKTSVDDNRFCDHFNELFFSQQLKPVLSTAPAKKSPEPTEFSMSAICDSFGIFRLPVA